MKASASYTAIAILALACTNAPPAAAPSTGSISALRALSSGTALERFLPLVGGHFYEYQFETDDGKSGILLIKIERPDERHGSWVLPGKGHNAFEYVADGVLTSGEHGVSYLLQAPLEAGRGWKGGNQSSVEVRRIDATVTVPAGTFEGCVETVESRGGDAPLSVTTAYCPKVGMVQRDMSTGTQHERLSLKSFGPPIDLGPDGTRVLKAETEATSQ